MNIILAQIFIVFCFSSDIGVSKVEGFCENSERPLLYMDLCLCKIIAIDLHQGESSVGFEVNARSDSKKIIDSSKLIDSKLMIIDNR